MASQSRSSKCSFITLCTSRAEADYHLLPFAAIVEPNPNWVHRFSNYYFTVYVDCVFLFLNRPSVPVTPALTLELPSAQHRRCLLLQTSLCWKRKLLQRARDALLVRNTVLLQKFCCVKTVWGFEGVWRGFNSWWWNRARTLHCTKQRANTFALKRNIRNCESCNALVSWEWTARGNTSPESSRSSKTAAKHLILQSKYDPFLMRFPYT